MMQLLLAVALFLYSWVILRRWLAWRRLPHENAPSDFLPGTLLTVIVPVRNEAATLPLLLQDLHVQRYPRHLLEVIIVDDHSDDGTAAVVTQFARNTDLRLRLVRLADYPGLRLKKSAVQKGVEVATGELLAFTDGDCRVGPDWLREFAFVYEKHQPYFISGPVTFHHTHSWFERMQLVEFASLIGVGAASIALRKPNMCNGANLAYPRQVFEKVGGFAGNEKIASGDDEFLLHKVHRLFPDRVFFLKSGKAIVYTSACKSLTAFMNQRTRWASKWKSYQSLNVQWVAFVVFLANLLLFLAIPFVWLGQLPPQWFMGAYIAKFAVDFLFLNRVLQFVGKQAYLWYMLPLQFVYIPYVVFTALFGLWGRYQWKGRTIETS